MVFSSAVFLFFFLPAVFILYFLSPAGFKNTILFATSLIFYAWGEPVYVSLMIFSTVLDYVCGRGVDRFRGRPSGKAFLVLSVVLNLSLLGFYKYYGSTVGGIPLPIGISFYTFQTMSYTIDVYRGDAPVQRNIISLGAFVALFPQLIAGPIVRYKSIADQLDERTVTLVGFGNGMRRFIFGLGKKVLLANSIGLLWNSILADGAKSVLTAWLGIVAFAFQLYFDFSGYSDMAIGLGRMFGFEFIENFDYPYISKSVSEFWRRWHISLGTWFRDYVYIPLGGSRKGTARTVLNLAIVWTLTGIWHGAALNYMLWGIYFGALIIAERLFLGDLLDRLSGVIGGIVRHAYLLVAVAFGWTLFAFEDMAAGLSYLGTMLGMGPAVFVDRAALYHLSNYGILVAVCALSSTPVYRKVLSEKRLLSWDEWPLMRAAVLTVTMSILLLSTAGLISSDFNPFLYFRF